jgi:hypothetical protein
VLAVLVLTLKLSRRNSGKKEGRMGREDHGRDEGMKADMKEKRER